MTWFLIAPSGHRYPVSQSGLSLGRAADNDIVLNDEEISRHHAFVQVLGEQAWLYDRNSFNGVYVSDVRISAPHGLRPGDVIRLGRTRLQVEHVPVSLPAAAPPPVSHPAATAPRPAPAGGMWQAAAAGAAIGLLGLALVVLFVVRPMLSAPAAPTPGANPYVRYVDAIRSAVFVLAPIEDTANAIAGSGVVLHENGRILTAYAVVYDPNTGMPYNRRSQVMVGLRSDAHYGGQALDRWYLARVVRADRQRDLAVLQIFAQQDGSPLPNSFALTPAPVGNAAAVRVGDPLALISFTGMGFGAAQSDVGRTLSLGEGQAVGFLPDAALGAERGWVATDIGLGLGNRGGLVLDSRGRLVGLYTGASSEGAGGMVSLLRPLDVATPLLAGAGN